MSETLNSWELLTLGCVFLIGIGGGWLVINHTDLSSSRFAGCLEDTQATQAMHSVPTPRVGGIIVVLAFSLGMILNWPNIGFDVITALGAGIFVFIAGGYEDIRRNVSSRIRFIAAFVSAGFAAFLSSTLIQGLGLLEIDWLFGFIMISIIVTLIWSAGFCHALNLIDGLNGLASGYAIFAASGLCIIAWINGQHDIVLTSALLITALAGFFVLNWPLGKIFLGDAGAYSIGHIIVWIGIVLMSRIPELSGFAILLILFWPVADTLLAIARRKIQKRPTDKPDCLHFHHIVARSLGFIQRENLPLFSVNAVATLILIPFFTMPIILGVWLWNQSAKALVAIFIFAILFTLSYVFGKGYFLSRLTTTHHFSS